MDKKLSCGCIGVCEGADVHPITGHYKEALQEATKLVQEYKLKLRRQHDFLVAIYNQANDLESGWTGPVYRDILSNIKRDAKRAIEGTE